MKHLYDSLCACQKEEEVKAEFCKFFKMKIFALRGIDHYTEHVLFEFKYDRNFRNPENVARVLAQTMYYARMLKYGAGLTRYPLPPIICVVDKNEAFFADTKDFAKFYAAKGDRYDWDRAPSTPCPKLVGDILAASSKQTDLLTPNGVRDPEKVSGVSREQIRLLKLPYIYDLTNPAEEEQFVEKCKEHLIAQMHFLELLEKKAITEDNFLDVFDYWDGLFGAYVRNGRKSSEYFLSDIEQGKSIVAQDGQVLFSVSGAEGYIPKTIQPEKYRHFWQNGLEDRDLGRGLLPGKERDERLQRAGRPWSQSARGSRRVTCQASAANLLSWFPKPRRGVFHMTSRATTSTVPCLLPAASRPTRPNPKWSPTSLNSTLS